MKPSKLGNKGRQPSVSLAPELFKHANLLVLGGQMLEMAHDGNNQLAIVSLQTEKLISGLRVIDPQQGAPLLKQAETLQEALTKLTDLFKNTLEIGRKEEKKHWFSVPETVQDICASFQQKMAEKSIHLQFVGQGDISRINGSPQKFSQVIRNLLKNAQQAIEHAGQIKVTVTPGASSVVIKVEDNGVGIPEEVLRTMFTPFVTTKKRGTGLGLVLVKHWVEEEMGGKVEVESVIGKRTAFILRLPVSDRAITLRP